MGDPKEDLHFIAYGPLYSPLPTRFQGEPGVLLKTIRFLAQELYTLKYAGQGVELEVPAQPHVPYLDAN
jgi:hypothetical protein